MNIRTATSLLVSGIAIGSDIWNGFNQDVPTGLIKTAEYGATFFALGITLMTQYVASEDLTQRDISIVKSMVTGYVIGLGSLATVRNETAVPLLKAAILTDTAYATYINPTLFNTYGLGGIFMGALSKVALEGIFDH